jgi:Ca-activated chloride channel family protein
MKSGQAAGLFSPGGVVSFAHPEQLWLLLMLPILSIHALRSRLKTAQAWAALAQRGRAPRDGTLALIGCAGCLIVAMAQPRFGQETSPPLPPGHDVMLAVDVSRSMAVEDAIPNRLALAVEAAETLVKALAADAANRVGLVAFAGRAVVRCPLTENLGALLESLRHLRPGTVQAGGTDLGAALDTAFEALGADVHAQGRAIIIFSDGEDHPARWNKRLERLREEDVVVHTVAIGDPEHGHAVPSGKNAKPLMYHGEEVRSQRSDVALEQIARNTGGTLVRLGLSSTDLGSLYQKNIEPAARRQRESSGNKRRAERFPLCLLAALAMLVTAACPLRRVWTWRWNWSWPWGWAMRDRKGKLVLRSITLCGFAAITGADSPSQRADSAQPAETIALGRRAYNERRFDDALTAFDKAVSLVPESPIPRYDAAAALFQLGHFEDAQERYTEARQLADPRLQTKIDFAQGNTYLALGDIPGAIASYDRCLASTAWGSDMDSVRADAAANRQFALEQSQSLTSPEGPSANEPSRSSQPDKNGSRDRRAGDDNQSGDAAADRAPDMTGSGSGEEPQKNPDRRRPPRDRRRMGVAGGGQTPRSGSGGDSPEEQLDTALEHIRAAQNRRLDDEESQASANDDRKDW